MDDEWKTWKFPGIYAIRHIESGKVYVGQSQDVAHRLWKHRRGNGKSHLGYAIKKHGWDTFEKILLERVDDLTLLDKREQYWMDILEATNGEKGYNLCPTAGSKRGWHPSERTRAILGEIRTANWKNEEYRAKQDAVRTEEYWARNRESNRIAHNTPEAIEKKRAISLVAQNRPETKEKKRQAMLGQKRTPEQIEHITEARNRPEAKAHMREIMLGKEKTPETRARMSAAQRTMKNTPEARALAREKALAQWERKRNEKKAAEESTQLSLLRESFVSAGLERGND